MNTPEIIINSNKKKYNYDKANWSLFRNTLERAEYPDNYYEIDSWYDSFQDIIISAANKSIPTSNTKKYDNGKRVNEWWNEDCQKQRAYYE